MNKYLTAAFGILILLIFGFAAGRWFVPVENTRTIMTTGECLSSVERDTTAITLRVTELNKDAGVSLSAARRVYATLAEYLRGIKDDTMKIQTVRFDTNEKTEWNHVEQKSVTLGFETNIEVSVSSKDRATIETILSHVGQTIDVIPGNLRMFTSPEKMKPALEACIQSAVENARDKAESIATADGVRVGKMISASYSRTTGGDMQPRPMMFSRAAGVMMDSAMPELFASDSDISVVVNISFQVR
ncbi:MAG: SIMPL domain-containing protein [Alphaproteobacteria bacterium]|nr:SIMPL domain-containing protein [Alphaproteobacteria bacterium]